MESKWVEEQMARLDPPAGWEPDTTAALQRHRVRRQEEWRRGPGFLWKVAMAAGIALAMAFAPPTRGLAQQLWRLLTVGRVQVLRVDLSDLPATSSLRAEPIQPAKMARVNDLENARQLAGFMPRLPRYGMLQGTPQLSVSGPAIFGTVLRADDVRQLLRKGGIDESVPAGWDGARITVRTAGIVMAEWNDSDTILIQSPPLTMAVPEGFELQVFTTLILRALKIPRVEAERLGARMATAPAWMLPISPGEKVGIREVSLNAGTGTLIYDYDEAKPDRVERLTLVWNTADRVYILSGPLGEKLAVATANAIE